MIDFKGYKLDFRKGTYYNNNSLAIIAVTETEEVFAYVTINMDYGAEPYVQWVDVNNCPADLIKQMEKNGYMKKTIHTIQSGFVTYPLYQFDKKWVDKLKEYK